MINVVRLITITGIALDIFSQNLNKSLIKILEENPKLQGASFAFCPSKSAIAYIGRIYMEKALREKESDFARWRKEC